MVIIRIYVVALRKYCWWCHSKICCPCAAGAIVAIAIVTNGTFKQVVDSRNRWWHIEMGGASKRVVGGRNGWWWVETGGGASKQVVGGQNRWWCVKAGGGWSKQLLVA